MKSDQLKTLVEYIDHQSKKAEDTLIEDFKRELEQIQLKEGPEGPRGYEGRDGLNGQNGINGKDGTNGQHGESGIIGEQGPMGLQGLVGEQGPPGAAFGYNDFDSDQLNALTGPRGLQGLPGAQGSKGENGDFGPIGSQGVPGTKGDPGPQGVKGDALQWSELTNRQRASLKGDDGSKGSRGEKGDKGEVGPMPKHRWVDGSHIQFQKTNTYRDDWGPKIDILGPQGLKGEPGPDGPKGDQGIIGKTGAKGKDGKHGKDFEKKTLDKAIAEIEKEHQKKIRILRAELQKLFDEKTTDLDLKWLQSRGGHLEMVVPIGAVDGDIGPGEAIIQNIKAKAGFRSGVPVFVDTPVRNIARKAPDAYDTNNVVFAAQANTQLHLADGLIRPRPSSRGGARNGTSYELIREGIVVIDPSVITDGNGQLYPGEYYYLDNTCQGGITSNQPRFGIAQFIGQAINTTEMYVKFNIDPFVVGANDLTLIDRNIPASRFGAAGDYQGATIYNGDTLIYICIKDWNEDDQSEIIWIRHTIDNAW